MNTSRTGKIARLPRHVRHELNRRLDDGHQAQSLLPWLNSLPEAQAVLANQFDSQPITESNLSNWRQGGFRDWQNLQGKRDRLGRFSETAAQLAASASPASLANGLCQILSADLALAATDLLAEPEDPKARWQLLRDLLPALDRLRHAEHRTQALALARRRTDILEAEARARAAEANRLATARTAAQRILLEDLTASTDPDLQRVAGALSECLRAAEPPAVVQVLSPAGPLPPDPA